MRNVKVEMRMSILGKMHNYVKYVIGDDEAYETWSMFAVPDEPDEDDLESIAEDDSLWAECARIFGKIVTAYEDDIEL